MHLEHRQERLVCGVSCDERDHALEHRAQSTYADPKEHNFSLCGVDARWNRARGGK